MMAMYEALGRVTLHQPIRSEGLLGTARGTINRDDPVDDGFLVA